MTRSQKTLNEKQNPKGEIMIEKLRELGIHVVPLSKEQFEAVKKFQKGILECAEARPFN